LHLKAQQLQFFILGDFLIISFIVVVVNSLAIELKHFSQIRIIAIGLSWKLLIWTKCIVTTVGLSSLTQPGCSQISPTFINSCYLQLTLYF